LWEGRVLLESTYIWANKDVVFFYPYPLIAMEIMKSIVLMFLKVAVNVRDSHVKRPGMKVTSLLDNQLKVFPDMVDYLTVGGGERGHEVFVKSG